MKKRNLFKTLMLVAAAALIMTNYSCAPKGKFIGLQLYSLRDSIVKDVPGTIEKVSKIGYKFVEPAGYGKGNFYGMSPEDFRKLCDKNNLPILSSHTGMALPDSAGYAGTMAWWDSCIDAHAKLGVKFIVQPFMGGDAYENLATLKKYCDYFNEVGAKCNAKGIRFGYHNHSQEFKPTKQDSTGAVIYDFMLENTDPSKVMFQMDLYWTVEGGANPIDYFNKYPGRFELWHIKDEKEIGASGKMDFQTIWANAEKSGMKYGIVEVEEYSFDTFTSVQKSLEFLNNAEYVVMPLNK
ncbi:MAG TPA: TIM barrel protein [Bacteroidales bacterium]|nr:TIM barrel protein [Bacteroidales bacterium]